MVDRISALEGLERARNFGPNLTIEEMRPGAIWQVTAWPDRFAEAGAMAARAAGVDDAPGPASSALSPNGWLLRTEPLRWLLISRDEVGAPDLQGAGTVLDLSHARTVIRLSGALAPDVMARQMPLDLRAGAFAEGHVATSSIHHVAVTVHARDGGLDLYCFRSFGRAIWEHLTETAEQFAAA